MLKAAGKSGACRWSIRLVAGPYNAVNLIFLTFLSESRHLSKTFHKKKLRFPQNAIAKSNQKTFKFAAILAHYFNYLVSFSSSQSCDIDN